MHDALTRALGVLRTVATTRSPLGMTVSDVAAVEGLERSRASRVLAELLRLGLVKREDGGGYVPSTSMVRLCTRAGDPMLGAGEDRVLRRLAVKTGETAFLAVRSAFHEGVIVSESRSDASFVAVARPGTHFSLPTSAAGRALLAGTSRSTLTSLLAPVAGGADRGAVTALAREIPIDGTAVSRVRDEDTVDLVAPVMRYGVVVGAMGIRGARFRTDSVEDELARSVSTTAGEFGAGQPTVADGREPLVAARPVPAGSLERAMAVMTVLAERGRGPATAAQVARTLGWRADLVSRLLDALRRKGFAARHPERSEWFPSWELRALAQPLVMARLRRHGQDVLDGLVESIGHNAYIHEVRATSSVTLVEAVAPAALEAASWVGRPFPLYASDSGMVLLADEEDWEIRALFSGERFQAFASNTPRSVDEFLDRCALAREHGWAIADEEATAGLAAISAPVRDARGAIVASVTISGPSCEIRAATTDIAAAVVAAAVRLSASLGLEAGGTPHPAHARGRLSAVRA